MPKKLSPQLLEKKKVPKLLMAGLMVASLLGWGAWKNLDKIKNYYQFHQIFPVETRAIEVVDGDTFKMKNGLTFRLLGIDAPNKGAAGYEESKAALSKLVSDKKLSIEYDTYQDDKYGRVLGYVWVSCSKELIKLCHENKMLVNEVMVKKGFAARVVYSKRKKLKYDSFLVPKSSLLNK